MGPARAGARSWQQPERHLRRQAPYAGKRYAANGMDWTDRSAPLEQLRALKAAQERPESGLRTVWEGLRATPERRF